MPARSPPDRRPDVVTASLPRAWGMVRPQVKRAVYAVARRLLRQERVRGIVLRSLDGHAPRASPPVAPPPIERRASLDELAESFAELDAPEQTALYHRIRDAVAPRMSPEEKLEAFIRGRDLAEADETSVWHALRVYGRFHRAIVEHVGGVAGRRILELGAGQSLVPGALLLTTGASQYVYAHLHRVARFDPEPFRLARQELDDDRGLVRSDEWNSGRAEMLKRFDAVVRFDAERATFDQDRLAVRSPVSPESLPFEDGSFDVCMSCAALEHVRDPAGAVRELSRVLKPGGVGLHQIDLRDHRDFGRPLDFLRYPEADWVSLFDPDDPRPLPPSLGARRPPWEYTNRWRRADFVSAFEAAGAPVVRATPGRTAAIPVEVRGALHPDFRGRPDADLEVLDVFLVARKARLAGNPT